MNNQNSFKKFNEISAEIANEHQRLKDTLAKRPPFPQVGDIVIFANPKTLGFQWVVIKINSQNLLMLPADNNPLAGSNDINSDLLTLRCGHKFSIPKKNFKNYERVGILDNWNLQYALELIEDIDQGNVRSSALQQDTDYDPEYQAWMKQVKYAVEEVKKPQDDTFWEKFIKLILPEPPYFIKFAVATGFAVMLAPVIIPAIINMIWPPYAQVNQVYQTIETNKTDQIEQKLAQLKFRWQKSAANGFGFSSNSPDSEAAKAFGAGLLFTKEALLGNTIKYNTRLSRKWKSDFNLARWTVLLWTASQQDMPEEFWKQQLDILSQFKAEFKDRKLVLHQLEKLEPYLSSSHLNNRALSYNLEKMMNFLAPRG